jgi:outer membrane protein OmpA-like peptidoglycan-associated protein
MSHALHLCWIGLILLAQIAAAQTPRQLQHGLQAAYYRGVDFDQLVRRQTDARIDFDWHTQSPAPGVPEEYFSVRWTGYLYAPVTGNYEFYVTADDGFRLWIEDKLLLDAWREQRDYSGKASLHLTKGKQYRLRAEYFQGPLATRALLAWVRPDAAAPPSTMHNFFGLQKLINPVPVPAEYLYSDAPSVPKPVAATAPVVVAQPEMQPVSLVVARKPVKASAKSPGNPVRARRFVPRQRVLADLGTSARGTIVELQSLYFEQSKARLLPSSLPEMERLAQALRQQPSLRLQIAGHTDNVGDPHLNQLLSQQRAENVRSYLIRQGIAADRLEAIGYGSTKPVADTTDATQRPRNRRVEVVVL